MAYNRDMSRVLESFEFLDRGWDVRVLENQSARTLFLWLLPVVFVLGADTAILAYNIFHRRPFDWAIAMNLAILILAAFRYGRTVYRQLGPATTQPIRKSD